MPLCRIEGSSKWGGSPPAESDSRSQLAHIYWGPTISDTALNSSSSSHGPHLIHSGVLSQGPSCEWSPHWPGAALVKAPLRLHLCLEHASSLTWHKRPFLPRKQPLKSSFLPRNLCCKKDSFPPAPPCLSMFLPQPVSAHSPAWWPTWSELFAICPWVPPHTCGQIYDKLPEVKNYLFICTVIVTRLICDYSIWEDTYQQPAQHLPQRRGNRK